MNKESEVNLRKFIQEMADEDGVSFQEAVKTAIKILRDNKK